MVSIVILEFHKWRLNAWIFIGFATLANDISWNLSSKVQLYANNTLILTEQGVVDLCKDLNTILKWSIDWQMLFNPNKLKNYK